jgi:hypothetical protein
MSLAYSYVKHFDELYADFQSYYGLDLYDFEEDLSGTETTRNVLRAAILCEQLPRDSRTKRVISPALSWSDESYLLARCDYVLRVIAWMFSEDGSKGANKPAPIRTPADIAADTEQVESTDFDFVDSILNKNVESG